MNDRKSHDTVPLGKLETYETLEREKSGLFCRFLICKLTSIGIWHSSIFRSTISGCIKLNYKLNVTRPSNKFIKGNKNSFFNEKIGEWKLLFQLCTFFWKLFDMKVRWRSSHLPQKETFALSSVFILLLYVLYIQEQGGN